LSAVPVRDATPDDAAACAAVYRPYVTGTAVSFETRAPTTAEMARRIAQAQDRHAWLVHEEAGRVLGYAYGVPYLAREAYRWSTAVSVYLHADAHGRGLGRALYTALLDRLAARGYRMALAGITLPNEASEALHRALGFEPIGVHRRVGWKQGRWRDVLWTQRPLGDDDDPPAEPR
jgi:phosphinothricin acetyltransferase